MDNLPLHGRLLRRILRIVPGRDVDRLFLCHDYLIARHTRSRHHHNERHILVARRHHRRDHPALTVPNQSNFVRIDLGARFEIRHARLRVGCKVRRRCPGENSRRLANPSIIGSQHGNSAPRQVVRQNQKRFVPQQTLVAILRTRAGNQHHRGERSLAPRNRECRGQNDALPFVFAGDILLVIRIRPYRILRPLRFLLRIALERLQHQRECFRALRPLALDRRAIRRDLPFKHASNLVYLNPQRCAIAFHRGDRQPYSPLVGTVERRLQPVVGIHDPENYLHRDDPRIERSEPRSINVRRRHRLVLDLGLIFRPLEYDRYVSPALRPRPRNRLSISRQLAFVGPSKRRHVEIQHRTFQADGVHWNCMDSPINTVECGLERGVRAFGELEHRTTPAHARVKRAWPTAGEVLAMGQAARQKNRRYCDPTFHHCS